MTKGNEKAEDEVDRATKRERVIPDKRYDHHIFWSSFPILLQKSLAVLLY